MEAQKPRIDEEELAELVVSILRLDEWKTVASYRAALDLQDERKKNTAMREALRAQKAYNLPRMATYTSLQIASMRAWVKLLRAKALGESVDAQTYPFDEPLPPDLDPTEMTALVNRILNEGTL